MTPDQQARRPLQIRNAKAAQSIASWLSSKAVTPNQISIASVVFAALGAFCLLTYSNQLPWLALLSAVFIQCRLLCNLFDGMVAVEGGKGTDSGELFNDIPDRIADPLLLIATGYAAGHLNWAIELGWLAGLLAVMTAYVRTLAASLGAPVDFSGPMAKQHRMALLTLACVITGIGSQPQALFIALVIINLGCLITVIRRIIKAYRFLETRPQETTDAV